jgi:hypothetical protein
MIGELVIRELVIRDPKTSAVAVNRRPSTVERRPWTANLRLKTANRCRRRCHYSYHILPSYSLTTHHRRCRCCFNFPALILLLILILLT